MEYRRLGRTGLVTSLVGFGCGDVGGVIVRGEPEARRVAVQHALEGGINYFDTAASYGSGLSEEHLGETLRELGATPYIGTKIRIEPEEVADARAIVRRKLEEGLRRLGRDRVDICTLHNQVGSRVGALPAAAMIGPIADAMASLVADGLTGAIGFTGIGETEALQDVARSGRFDVFQCYYNAINCSASREGRTLGSDQDFAGLLDVAAEHGTAAIAIRVLAGGAFSDLDTRHPLAADLASFGRPVAGNTYSDDVRRVAAFRNRLSGLGMNSVSELATRFAISNERIGVALVGMSDVAQVDAAVAAAGRGALDEETMAAIRTIDA